ncbi:MAG: hypothetical protein IPO87_14775 [Flavobacteriales bacterium]|nr:hypothetical protein [Flavobacteriales bacterium]
MENPAQRSERAGFWPWIFRVIAPHAVVVLVLLTLIRAWLPPFWGSPGLAYKIEHVLEANEQFDRVFIGSSHLFRQVDPQVLDSAINDGGHSFNMALNACFAPESEMACEYVLNNSATPPKVICLELMPYILLQDKNFDHYRYWYYMNAENCIKLIRHTWRLKGTKRRTRLEFLGREIKAFAYAFSFPGLRDRFFGDGSRLDTGSVMGPNRNGLVPFEWQAGYVSG